MHLPIFQPIPTTHPQHIPQPSPPPPVIPLRHRIKPNQRLGPDIIPNPEHLRNIHIERTIGLRAGQQLVHARHGGGNRVRRRPARLQQVEADLARLEVDVGVADGRYEAD